MRRKLEIALVVAIGCVGLAFAADQTILGKALSVKDPKPGVDATKRKVTVSATEKNSTNTIVGDPTLMSPAGGGVLEVYVYGGVDLSQTFVLAQGTSSKGKPFWSGTSAGYTYKDAAGDQGPVKSVSIKRSSSGTVTIKATVQGKYGTIDVLPPNPGTSGCAVLQLGVDAGFGDRYSVQFGDESEIKNSGATAFGAKKPLDEGVCVVATTTTPTTSSTTTTTTLVDPCTTANGGCDPLTSCANQSGTPVCGPCPSGYTGTGATACNDLNECAVNNGGCTSPTPVCANSPGTFGCGPCSTGYVPTGPTCTDVNECATNNGGCSPLVVCTNNPGSFGCGSCPSGYAGNGIVCNDLNECATNNGGCTSPTPVCANSPGGFGCGPCSAGYFPTGSTCTDVNECAVNNGGCTSPTPVCANSPGSFGCGPCSTGYVPSGSTCIDVNECATNNGGCSPLVVCTNIPGSRNCGACPSGYTGPGTTCTDINECATNNGGCMVPTPVCVNSAGGWICN